MLETKETSNGMQFKFKGSDNTIDLLASIIKTERFCYDFFTFTLAVDDEESFAWLELSGPEGTKEFVKNEIGF